MFDKIGERQRGHFDAQSKKDNAKRHMSEIASRGLQPKRASLIEPKPVAWLWPGRFAYGKVGIIAGDPGLGKSQIAIDMAARVSTGGRWPCSAEHARRGHALIVTAEDGAADTILPRLDAAGANLRRIHIVDAIADHGGARRFSLIDDIGRLDTTLQLLDRCRLVIVDPMNATLTSANNRLFNSNSATEMRGVVGRLEALAARHRVAIVVITHFTKAHSRNPPMQITGSEGLVAAVRSAFTVMRDQRDPSRRIFASAKNNFAADTEGLAFRIVSRVTTGEIRAPWLDWERPMFRSQP
jgi:putative DNA primase/helicase